MVMSLLPVIFFMIAAMNPIAPAPPGFRYPTKADQMHDWKTFEKQAPTPYHAQSDFNGDGVTDHVWILLRTSGTGWGLFVFLGQKNDPPVVVKLEEDDDRTPAQRLGVAIADPGEYATACGKGYWDLRV